MKQELKEKALILRRNGFTYSEILKKIPVAKSTLSLWLRSVGLSQRQKQRLTEKKLISMRKGWEARRKQRRTITESIKQKARSDIKTINNKELWLLGVMLYWAEGSKEKIGGRSSGIIFSNSDSYMIKIFLKWLKAIFDITGDKLTFQIYIHDNCKEKTQKVMDYWSEVAGYPMHKFGKIYFKKHNPKTRRKNQGNDYYGLMRIIVKKSTNLNRQIAGWIEGIYNKCGIV